MVVGSHCVEVIDGCDLQDNKNVCLHVHLVVIAVSDGDSLRYRLLVYYINSCL